MDRGRRTPETGDRWQYPVRGAARVRTGATQHDDEYSRRHAVCTEMTAE